MIRPYVHVTCQSPQLNLYQSLWENTYDSSWIARDLGQTVHLVANTHILHQVSQIGQSMALVVFGLFFVFLDGMYRNHEDDLMETISDKRGKSHG